MKRRVLAVVASVATAVAVLPAAPALAAAESTAALTSGTSVFPGGDRPFTIRVTNNEMPVFGRTIDTIRVNFPVTEAGVRLGNTAGSAPGFKSKATDLGTTQFLTFGEGSLLPGQSVDLTFPATVSAPLAKDLLGDFRVQVSSDRFATASPARGALTTAVKVLELLPDGLAPVGPTNEDGSKGVTDGTGTAGQAITYAAAIRNHSRSALSVTTGLTSDGGDTAQPQTVPVPAGGAATATIPVELAEGTADRTAKLTAAATAPGAEAPRVVKTFGVQAPATLAYSGLQPTRTPSGDGSGRTFTVTLTKAGARALDVATSTLSFGDNSASMATPVSYGPGAGSAAAEYPFLEVVGADGSLPATVTSSVVDDNLFGYDVTGAAGNIVIDNVAPVVALALQLPKDGDGDQQTATKDGDTLSVSGTIDNAEDLVASSLQVVLSPDAGDSVTVPVQLSGSGAQRTFSGSTTADWADDATSFVALASAQDTTGNTGDAQTDTPVLIDNVAPVLTGPGVVRTPTLVVVDFEDLTGTAGGCNANAWRIDGRIGSVKEVRTSDGSPCTESGAGGRQLVLDRSLSVDATPQVSYTAPSTLVVPRPAKDGAGNVAPAQSVKTVTDQVPLAPRIRAVERRGPEGEFETAYRDGDDLAYYTNVSGPQAIQLTVGGVRPGWTIEVLDGGAVVASQLIEKPLPMFATEYDGSILVPLDAGDGSTPFDVRVRSSNGNASETRAFTVVLDTVAPQLGDATVTPGEQVSTATVTFDEKIVTGADVADNWFFGETVETEEGTAVRHVNVDRVSGGDLFSRTFDVTLSDPAAFAGIDFLLSRRGSHRYEDRAGNQLADTLQRQ